MEEKILFVVNPASAGKSTGKEWPVYEQQLRSEGYSFDVVYTEYHEHAIELTREALKKGYRLIVSVGGDGTMNEVVNGFFENSKPINEEARLAVFSRGTGCDFVRTLGTGKSFEDFVKVLKRNRTERLDVGKAIFRHYRGDIEEKYFLNVADIGLGGDTTDRVNKTSKALKGFLSFLIGAMISILFYRNKKFQITIDDKISMDEKINSIIIANGRYFGGGMHVAPKAVVNDGLFDIVILGNLNKLELLSKFPTIYKGEHLSIPKVKCFRGRRVSVKCMKKALLEVDGEQPGMADAHFELLPGAINILT